MGTVIYSMGVSLDGFIAGPDGAIDCCGTGRGLMLFPTSRLASSARTSAAGVCYQDMLPWETAGGACRTQRTDSPGSWKALPKVVFSSPRDGAGQRHAGHRRRAPGTGNAQEQSGKDLSGGGAGLASTLAELDLIDEYRLFVSPVVLGRRHTYFPALDSRIALELVETRDIGARVVYSCYRRR